MKEPRVPTGIDTIVAQIRALPADQQIAVAEAVDRLTWSHRWRAICDRISTRNGTQNPVSDQQIDDAVHEVRKETPLSARSSTHPS